MKAFFPNSRYILDQSPIFSFLYFQALECHLFLLKEYITSGLWAWSRHPNYFGEITFWVGLTLIALPVLSGWQLVTLISPIFVYVLLTRISGIPMLENRGMKKWGSDPEYMDYLQRTPSLLLKKPNK